MRAVLSFILLLVGGLLIGVTVEDSIIGSSIVKGLGTIFFIGFLKMVPKNNRNLS